MTTPSTNLGMSSIQAEFGGANPIALSEYYGKGGAPASGTIRMSQFRGVSSVIALALTSGVHPLTASLWGFFNDVINGGQYSYGSLVPSTVKGATCVEVVQTDGLHFEVTILGNRAQAFFTSVRVAGSGFDATVLPANASWTYDSTYDRTQWNWAGVTLIPSKTSNGTVYFT